MFSSWLDRISSNAIYLNDNIARAVFCNLFVFLFIAGFRTWDLPLVFFREIGGWLASNFSNQSKTWFLDCFFNDTWQKLLFDRPLPIFGESILVRFQARSVPAVWLRCLLLILDPVQILSTWNHLMSARLVWNHYRVCSPMLQTLENLTGCPWLCLGISKVFGTRLCLTRIVPIGA